MPRPVQRKRAPGAALQAESCFFFVLIHPENGFPGAGRTGVSPLAPLPLTDTGGQAAALEPLGPWYYLERYFPDGALFKNFADLALGRNAKWSQQRFRCRHCSSAPLRSFVLFHLAAQHRFPVCGPLVRLAVDNVGCNMIVKSKRKYSSIEHISILSNVILLTLSSYTKV